MTIGILVDVCAQELGEGEHALEILAYLTTASAGGGGDGGGGEVGAGGHGGGGGEEGAQRLVLFRVCPLELVLTGVEWKPDAPKHPVTNNKHPVTNNCNNNCNNKDPVTNNKHPATNNCSPAPCPQLALYAVDDAF